MHQRAHQLGPLLHLKDIHLPLQLDFLVSQVPRVQQSDQRLVGRRHVEIRKPGLPTFSQNIEVRSGETVTLNVSLGPVKE